MVRFYEIPFVFLGEDEQIIKGKGRGFFGNISLKILATCMRIHATVCEFYLLKMKKIYDWIL